MKDLTSPSSAETPSFYVTGGTMPRNAASYITRRADHELLEGLRRGEFCYILTSRQMGKSSLMVRAAATLQAEDGAISAVLDLTAIGQNLSAEQWYDGLLNQLGRRLNLEEELEDFWFAPASQRLGPLHRWMLALEEIVLRHYLDRQIVVFVDEIDAVRSLPFSADEFFAAIRECYNRRPHNPAFKRLTFCLLGTATPAELIKDAHLTPFNVGRRIDLKDFTRAEARPLAAGLLGGQKTLLRILDWTSGHPYLTQQLCQMAVESSSAALREIDHLVEGVFLSPSARATDDNLKLVSHRLLRADCDRFALLRLYGRVGRGRGIADDETNPLCDLLKLSGIVRVERGLLRVRNAIYQRVFDRRWIQDNMPDAEARRERSAYRRGALRTLALSGVVIAVVVGLAAFGFSQAQLAREKANEASVNALREAAARQEAERNAIQARRQTQVAERQTHLADQQARAEIQARAEAERQRRRADSKTGEATRALEQTRQANLLTERKAREATENLALAERRLGDVREANLLKEAALSASKRSAALAVQRAEEAERTSYITDMNLIQTAWDLNDVSRVTALVEETKDYRGRGFEWGYWNRLCHLFSLELTDKASPLRAAAFSPDGKRIATGGNDGAAQLWDAATGKEIFTIKGHQRAISSIAFSPDGKRIVTGGEENIATVWNADNGRETLTLKGHARLPLPVNRGPDGVLSSGPEGVFSVAFSPDGKRIATASEDTTAKVWDALSGKALLTLRGHTQAVCSVAFSPDGKRIITGSNDKTTKIWDAATGKETLTLEGNVGAIHSAAFSPDGKRIVVCAGDVSNPVQVRDAGNGKLLLNLVGHTNGVLSVAFSPDGRRIVSGGYDEAAHVWDALTGEQILALKGHSGNIYSVAFSPDNRFIVTASEDGSAKVWDVRIARTFLSVGREGDETLFQALSPDGKRVAKAESDHDLILSVCDSENGDEIFPLKGHQDALTSMAFSPDGGRIATSSLDKTVRLWDARTGAALHILGGHEGGLLPLAFSADGKSLLVGDSNGTARIWDVASGQKTRTLKGHSGAVLSVAFSLDGKRVITGSEDNTARIWDTASGKTLFLLRGHHRRIRSVAFSADNRRVVTGSSDRTLKVWDAQAGKPLLTLAGHNASVISVAFSPDGQRIVSGGDDKTARVWETQTGRETLRLPGFVQEVFLVAFSPDGRRIITNSLNANPKIWSADGGPSGVSGNISR